MISEDYSTFYQEKVQRIEFMTKKRLLRANETQQNTQYKCQT